MKLSSFLSNIIKSPDSSSSLQYHRHTDAETELNRINKEMYERNVELAIRNRTLSVLRQLYDIINTTIGVKSTAQKLIDDVVGELSFQKGFIALIDRENKLLKTIAVSQSPPNEQIVLDQYKHPFWTFSIPLSDMQNFCVNCAMNNRRRLTTDLSDVLDSTIPVKDAARIQQALAIQTCILYPLSFGGRMLGMMMIGMNKHIGELSRAERETLHELIEVISIAIERAQVVEDLQVANDHLKELDKLKDEFVYIASHELRTPMTAIKNYLWLAINKHNQTLTDDLRVDLDRAYSSTERLIHLVQDMLTVSRIEGKRLLFDFKVTDMNTLIKQVVDELSSTAKDKQLALSYVPSTEIFNVSIDTTRIIEALHNIIGNSLKFTPTNGSIVVSVRKNQGMIEIAVSDTGPGIPKADIPRLFQKFGRLGHSYKRLTGETGTGLGLFISKQIIEAQGGKIWVESVVDQGTTFTFSLPDAGHVS